MLSNFTHDQLQVDLDQSATIRLFRSPHAALILSFLHQQFKREQRARVTYNTMLSELDAYLEALNELQPGTYVSSARDYLKQWSDEKHRLIRIYTPRNTDEDVVELTRESVRALSWLEELHQSTFIGTESRLMLVFSSLEEIIAKSTEDPQVRLSQLERDREAIQREIDEIRATGAVKRFSPTQLRERFLQVGTTAAQMLNDFTLVEENFRLLARRVQEEQLQPDARKGALVASVLAAEQKLKESDEGRSFYAFWEFLMLPQRQDELRGLLAAVYELPELRDLTQSNLLLRRLSRYLLDAGEKIVQSNQQLARQLKQMLDERILAETRRVRALVTEIKQTALKLRATAPDEALLDLDLEGLPEVQLPLDKLLWEPSEPIQFGREAVQVAHGEEVDYSALLYQFYVDEQQLRRHLESLLQEQNELTLGDIFKHFPIRFGLTEVVAYFLLATKDSRSHIDLAHSQQISYRLPDDDDQQERQLTIPLVTFTRSPVSPVLPALAERSTLTER